MGGPKNTTQTTKVELSPEQKQLLELAMPFAENFAANPPQAVGVEPFNQNQIAGQNSALAAAQGAQTNLANAGASAGQFLLSGDALRPDSNPALQEWISAATRPITQNLLEQQLPALRGSAVTAGGYGGSRQGIAEGLASGRASQAIGDTTANIANQGYQAGLDAMTKASSLLPVYQGAQTAPAQTMSSVGDQQRAMAEALRGSVNEEQMIQLLMAKELAALTGAIPGGSTTATGTAAGASPLQNALGMGLSGMSLFGPLGGLAGGLGGLGLSLFGMM